jgi:endothelin-converting enzyme/putative endopeptidase
MTILDDARSGMDPTVRPQDDLFGHVNGRWLTEVEIPSDRASWGAFAAIAEKAEHQVCAIVEECADAAAQAPKGSPAQQIGDLWTSFMDEERIEALGASPLAGDLSRLAQVADHEQLAAYVGGLERRGGSGFFGAYVDTDDRDSDRYLVHLVQGARRTCATSSGCSTSPGCRRRRARPSGSWRSRPGSRRGTGNVPRPGTSSRATT